MMPRFKRSSAAALVALALLFSYSATMTAIGDQAVTANGIVKVESAYSMVETVARLKKDIADKGILFFAEIDQSKLAADAGIALSPSILLIFGNPPLGAQFMTSNPESGIDWPVRLLLFEDAQGQVWMVYSDFTWIAHRHGITDRDPQFKMASMVIASITSSVSRK